MNKFIYYKWIILCSVTICIIQPIGAHLKPAFANSSLYGECKEISVAAFEDEYCQANIQIIKKMLERHELNLGGSLNVTLKQFLKWRDDAKGDVTCARYQLNIKYNYPYLIGEVINIETCEVLINEKVEIGRINEIDGNSFGKSAAALWSALTFRRQGSPAGTITERLTKDIEFGNVDYYDYGSGPNYHPVSPPLAILSHKIELLGKSDRYEVEYYEPGYDLEVTLTYKECDDIPIKGVDILVRIVDAAVGVYLIAEDGRKGNEITILTNEKGQGKFKIFSEEGKGYKDIVLLAFKDSKCENSRIIDETIIIKSNEKWVGTLDVTLSPVPKYTNLLMKNNLTITSDIEFIIDWMSLFIFKKNHPRTSQDVKKSVRYGLAIGMEEFGDIVLNSIIDGFGEGVTTNTSELYLYSPEGPMDGWDRWYLKNSSIPPRVRFIIHGVINDSRKIGLAFYAEPPIASATICTTIKDSIARCINFIGDILYFDHNSPNNLNLKSPRWPYTLRLFLNKDEITKNGFCDIKPLPKGTYKIKLKRVYD